LGCPFLHSCFELCTHRSLHPLLVHLGWLA
jgi:hypothetical protein